MPGKAEKFIIKVDDIKQSMGMWYSLFARRILPFLVFVIPINVILARILNFIQVHILTDVRLSGNLLLIVWAISMIAFLTVLLFAPKLATAAELAVGFVYIYIYIALRVHLLNNLFGWSVLISVILFVLVKLVFLAFKIVQIKIEAGDDENIERDESGRIIRASDDKVVFSEVDENEDDGMDTTNDDVYYTEEDENAQYDYDAVETTEMEAQVLFTENEDYTEDYENEQIDPAEDDLVFDESDEYENYDEVTPIDPAEDNLIFTDIDEYEENDKNPNAVPVDDDLVFTEDDAYPDLNAEERMNTEEGDLVFADNDESKGYGEGAISDSDNDYFFG